MGIGINIGINLLRMALEHQNHVATLIGAVAKFLPDHLRQRVGEVANDVKFVAQSIEEVLGDKSLGDLAQKGDTGGQV